MRTIVEIPDDQLAALKAECEREQISRAEAIRRALAEWLEAPDRKKARRRAVLDATFGAWKHLGIDGLEYQRRIRAEWDRDWDPD
jgi:Arc/MetJ-type ribon-helix-helix transcriptional regulator